MFPYSYGELRGEKEIDVIKTSLLRLEILCSSLDFLRAFCHSQSSLNGTSHCYKESRLEADSSDPFKWHCPLGNYPESRQREPSRI